MALLGLDDSLLRFSQLKNSCQEGNKTSFIRDWCCHLPLSLHLMEPHYQLPQSIYGEQKVLVLVLTRLDSFWGALRSRLGCSWARPTGRSRGPWWGCDGGATPSSWPGSAREPPWWASTTITSQECHRSALSVFERSNFSSLTNKTQCLSSRHLSLMNVASWLQPPK